MVTTKNAIKQLYEILKENNWTRFYIYANEESAFGGCGYYDKDKEDCPADAIHTFIKGPCLVYSRARTKLTETQQTAITNLGFTLNIQCFWCCEYQGGPAVGYTRCQLKHNNNFPTLSDLWIPELKQLAKDLGYDIREASESPIGWGFYSKTGKYADSRIEDFTKRTKISGGYERFGNIWCCNYLNAETLAVIFEPLKAKWDPVTSVFWNENRDLQIECKILNFTEGSTYHAHLICGETTVYTKEIKSSEPTLLILEADIDSHCKPLPFFSSLILKDTDNNELDKIAIKIPEKPILPEIFKAISKPYYTKDAISIDCSATNLKDGETYHVLCHCNTQEVAKAVLNSTTGETRECAMSIPLTSITSYCLPLPFDATLTLVRDEEQLDIATVSIPKDPTSYKPSLSQTIELPIEKKEYKIECPIAVCCYGTDLVDILGPLRSFRDKYLQRYRPTRQFIKFYYKTLTPLLSPLLLNHHKARLLIQKTLRILKNAIHR